MFPRAVAIIVAALLFSVPAAADDLDRLMALDLPVIEGSVEVHYSPSAEAEARVYAATFQRAVPWFRETLDWRGAITMAVLDPDDYRSVAAFIPYPVPYADTGGSGRLVVMPDRIDTFPGFDMWDLDGTTLNAALTLHEVGHIIAAQTGIAPGNHWVNELIADVFLAGYARAEEPAFTTLLNGVPPRFADAGQLTYLHELDALYAGVGLENYAWFQFRLADMADHIVTGRDFADVIAALRSAFPADERRVEPLSATLAKLELIAPGVTAFADGMTEPSALPSPALEACALRPALEVGDVALFIQNRGDTPLRFTSISHVATMAGVAVMAGEIGEGDTEAFVAEAMADFRFASTLEPGEQDFSRPPIGDVVAIEGAGCFVVPDRAARFVWTGN